MDLLKDCAPLQFLAFLSQKQDSTNQINLEVKNNIKRHLLLKNFFIINNLIGNLTCRGGGVNFDHAVFNSIINLYIQSWINYKIKSPKSGGLDAFVNTHCRKKSASMAFIQATFGISIWVISSYLIKKLFF